jgi:hypothetical protein
MDVLMYAGGAVFTVSFLGFYGTRTEKCRFLIPYVLLMCGLLSIQSFAAFEFYQTHKLNVEGAALQEIRVRMLHLYTEYGCYTVAQVASDTQPTFNVWCNGTEASLGSLSSSSRRLAREGGASLYGVGGVSLYGENARLLGENSTLVPSEGGVGGWIKSQWTKRNDREDVALGKHEWFAEFMNDYCDLVGKQDLERLLGDAETALAEGSYKTAETKSRQLKQTRASCSVVRRCMLEQGIGNITASTSGTESCAALEGDATDGVGAQGAWCACKNVLVNKVPQGVDSCSSQGSFLAFLPIHPLAHLPTRPLSRHLPTH